MSDPFTWTCEDDEEAIGMRTILGRAGLAVLEEVDGEQTILRVEGDQADEARALTSKIASHFVGAADVDRAAKLTATRRRTDRGLIAVATVVVAAALLLLAA